MSPPYIEKSLRFRIRFLCGLAGMWGVATGYAIFILISQRAQDAPGLSAAIHFLVVLTVAVVVVAITEWFRDTIRGEKPEAFRSLSAILASVLLLAVFEVCVLAYEEVSQATFESPYALKEIAARVSGKEIPYQFFRLDDVPEPGRLLARLRAGYQDMQANKPSPEASVVSEFGPEIRWTLFPDDAAKPARHDALVSIVQAKLADCARLQTITPPFHSLDCESDLEAAPASPPMSLADQADYERLLEKLHVLRGDDDSEMHYFPSEPLPHSDADIYAMFSNVYAGVHPVTLDTSLCNADDPKCPVRRMADVSVLANMTARDLWSEGRLRELLTIEFNHAILSPGLYNQSAFQFVEVPEALKQLLKQNEEDTSSYANLLNRMAYLKAQQESEGIDERVGEIQDELDHVESRLLPLPRQVQLNRQILAAAFAGLLMPAKDQFDQSSANLMVLGLLWMLAGGALGWILAEGIFEESKPETHASRRGALRGLVAAFAAAPVLVVAYVLVVRLGTLIYDVMRFPRELHYLWDPSGTVPRDLLDSTLIPLALRLSGYWDHKWTTLGVFLSIMAILGAFWLIYGRRRGMAAAQQGRWLAVSGAAVVVSSLIFDANIPFIYLLVALVWITPAVFLGICGPYLRTSSPVPRAWGLISMLAGTGLMLLTLLRLWWSAIPLWLLAPGALLIAIGLVMRAGRRLEEYWPLGALALGLSICGMSALVQRATFLGVLSDVHDLNAYGGYQVKLWPKVPLPHVGKPVANHPPPGSWSEAFLAYERQPRTPQGELKSDFEMHLDVLRSEASGFGATGDTLLDNGLTSYQEHNKDVLRRTRDDVTRRLELSIVGSLGFWLSVGLLAGWAMRNHPESEEPSAPSGVGSAVAEESL